MRSKWIAAVLGVVSVCAIGFALLGETRADCMHRSAWLSSTTVEEDVTCPPCTVPCANKKITKTRTYWCDVTANKDCVDSATAWTDALRDVTCVEGPCGTGCLTHPWQYWGVGKITTACE